MHRLETEDERGQGEEVVGQSSGGVRSTQFS